MTVIAAVRDPARRKTLIGSDSRATQGNAVLATTCRKLIVKDGAALGISGYGAAIDVLSRVSGLFDGDPLDICWRMRDAIKASEWEGDGDKGPWGAGCSFILVARQHIYDVDNGFCPSLIREGALWARGSGSDYAIGAGHALTKAKPRDRLKAALEAACHFDTGCAPPFSIAEIEW